MDKRTSAVTFLFTRDDHFVTDSELSIEGECNLFDEWDKPHKLTSYLNWLFTSAWMDSVQDLSGNAVWYAALRKDPASSEYGKIAGFVQSRYLKLDE